MGSPRKNYIRSGDLEIARPVYELVNDEIIPGTGVAKDHFWSELARIAKELGPRNDELVTYRDDLQKKIDDWHIQHRKQEHNAAAYKAFLVKIGYLVRNVDDFQITTKNIDNEIAKIAGPQLVVPLDNARYVLNAANARWGSLYDALYSSDAIPESDGCKKIKKYNPIRGEKVIRFSRNFLDRNFPLEKDTHHHSVRYYIENGQLMVQMGDATVTTLLRPEGFTGYSGNPEKPDRILLGKHGLHVELRFGEGFFIGRRDHAKIYDIHMEAAITSIMDCEDSVASVDTEDKVRVYRNWLGLMKGTLKQTIEKDNEVIERTLAEDRHYLSGNQAIYITGTQPVDRAKCGHAFANGFSIAERQMYSGNDAGCHGYRTVCKTRYPWQHGKTKQPLWLGIYCQTENAWPCRSCARH